MTNNNCFLFGYHCLGNIGDDLMAMAFLKTESNKYKKVYSRKSKYSVGNFEECDGYILFKMLLLSDSFVTTGGNIFSYERKKSYLKLLFLFFLLFIRKKLNKISTIDSVGLDLKVGKWWRWFVVKILNQCSNVSLRDNLSYRYVRRYISKNVNFSYKYDRVYRNRTNLEYLTEEGEPKCENYIFWFISEPGVRKSKKVDKDIAQIIQNISKIDCGKMVYLFCQEPGDVLRSKLISKLLSDKSYETQVINYDFEKISDTLNKVKNADLIITERYHGAILAENFDKPWVTLQCTEKLTRVRPNKNLIRVV